MKMKSQSVTTIVVHYFVEIQYKDINLKNSFSCEKMYSKCCWYKIEEADQIDDVYGYCNGSAIMTSTYMLLTPMMMHPWMNFMLLILMVSMLIAMIMMIVLMMIMIVTI